MNRVRQLQVKSRMRFLQGKSGPEVRASPLPGWITCCHCRQGAESRPRRQALSFGLARFPRHRRPPPQALKLSLAWPSACRSPKRLTASLRIEAPAKISTPSEGSTGGSGRAACTCGHCPDLERLRLQAQNPPARADHRLPAWPPTPPLKHGCLVLWPFTAFWSQHESSTCPVVALAAFHLEIFGSTFCRGSVLQAPYRAPTCPIPRQPPHTPMVGTCCPSMRAGNDKGPPPPSIRQRSAMLHMQSPPTSLLGGWVNIWNWV